MVATRRQGKEHEKVEISIIIPAYKEKDNLAPLVERLCKAMGPTMTNASEIIVVDDNSKDGSKEVRWNNYSRNWTAR
jgi:glycosyltransferase involved in cell wall biosynthesis